MQTSIEYNRILSMLSSIERNHDCAMQSCMGAAIAQRWRPNGLPEPKLTALSDKVKWYPEFHFILITQMSDTISTKVCQMLSQWTKTSLHSINFWDTVTKLLPLCSIYHVPFYVPNLTLLAPFPTEFAHLSMLFTLEVVCADHLKNK